MSKKIYIGSNEIAGSDGKSAYQSWLDQGNTGTEAQFLASLKGADGKDGKDGAQGNTGSSVDYPYELVNNVTTNDATKGLSAAQGVTLKGQIDQLGLKAFGGVTIPFESAVSSDTGKYVDKNGKVASSGTATNTVAYYEIPDGTAEINISIPKTGNNASYPVSFALTSGQTTGLVIYNDKGTGGAKSYNLQLRDVVRFDAYLVINYDSSGGTPTINGKTKEATELVDVSEFDIDFHKTYTEADCFIGRTYIDKSTGNEHDTSGFFCSDFIPMPLDNFVITSNYTLVNAALVAFYDSNKSYIGYLSGASERTNYHYYPPVNTKYFRLSCKTNTSLSVAFSSAGPEALTVTVKELLNGEGDSEKKESVSILWPGNSFTENTLDNIGTMLTNLNVDNVSINKIIEGGRGLYYWDSTFSTTSFSTSRVYGNALAATGTLENILQTRHIDIIVLQQVSDNAGNYDSFVPTLASLINKIRSASVNKNIKIAFAMVWGTHDSSFTNIVNAAKLMVENHNYIDYVIPLGTAVESARISAISEGYNGFSFNDPIWHLANGFGEYLASCAFYQYMCERFTHIPITEDTTTISVSGGIGELAVTAENRGLAHTAAINASILKYTPVSLD